MPAGSASLICIFVGNTVSAAGEEDGGDHIHKRKRKKRKRSHFQSDTQDLGSVAEAAVPSADSEPGAAQRHALQACVAAPTAEATSNTRENSSEPTPATPIHSKRKRQRKKNLRAHREIWKSTTLPQEDVSKNDPASGQPQTALISSSEGGQARKRKRKLGALPVSSGDLTVQKAGTPASPVEGNDGQTTLPRCKRSQKKTASNTLDHYDPSSQKTAISKKRKKMKQTSNGVLECSAGQIQALVRWEGPRARVLGLNSCAQGTELSARDRDSHTSAKQWSECTALSPLSPVSR